MVLQLSMFKSGLSGEEVRRTMEERAPQYRVVPGLVQKLYVENQETGEFGAVYVWSDDAALRDFWQSELARTIPEAYRAEGQPRREILDVVHVLHEGAGPTSVLSPRHGS